jgi:hypothetical protein
MRCSTTSWSRAHRRLEQRRIDLEARIGRGDHLVDKMGADVARDDLRR